MSTWNDVGGNPAPGNPAGIRNVANHMGELSVTARLARRQIAALQRGELQACWTGVAADAFAAELERLPADLGKLERSLDHASTSVYRWATTVDHAQQQSERWLRDHGDAERRLRHAEYQRDREREAALRDAVNDPVGSIGDALSGNNRLAPYDRAVDDAYDQVRRTRDQIEQVRNEVDAVARTVARMLEEASRLGIQNDAWYEKIAEFLEWFREQLVEFLRALDAFLDAIGPFVGLALVIAGILTGNPAFAWAGLYLAGADLGVTVARAALGDETVQWKHLLDDTIDVALAAAGVGAAYAAAAENAGALAKGADIFIDALAGGKAIGDIAGFLFAGPGEPASVFEAFYQLAGGEGSVLDNPVNAGFTPINDLIGDLVNPRSGLLDGFGDLFGDLLPPDSGPMPGPDPAPMPGPDPAPMPGPDPAPMPGPDPAPMPQPDPAPVGGGAGGGGAPSGPAGGDFGGLPSADLAGGDFGGLPSADVAGGDFGGLPSADVAGPGAGDYGGVGGEAQGIVPGADLSVGYEPPSITADAMGTGPTESVAGLVADTGPVTSDAASQSAAGAVGASAGGGDSGGSPPTGLLAGAAAVAGLAGAAVGAKRLHDDRHDGNDRNPEAGESVWTADRRTPDVGRPVAVVDSSTLAAPAVSAGDGAAFDPEVTMDPALTFDPAEPGVAPDGDPVDSRSDHGQTIALTEGPEPDPHGDAAEPGDGPGPIGTSDSGEPPLDEVGPTPAAEPDDPTGLDDPVETDAGQHDRDEADHV